MRLATAGPRSAWILLAVLVVAVVAWTWTRPSGLDLDRAGGPPVSPVREAPSELRQKPTGPDPADDQVRRSESEQAPTFRCRTVDSLGRPVSASIVVSNDGNVLHRLSSKDDGAFHWPVQELRAPLEVDASSLDGRKGHMTVSSESAVHLPDLVLRWPTAELVVQLEFDPSLTREASFADSDAICLDWVVPRTADSTLPVRERRTIARFPLGAAEDSTVIVPWQVDGNGPMDLEWSLHAGRHWGYPLRVETVRADNDGQSTTTCRLDRSMTLRGRIDSADPAIHAPLRITYAFDNQMRIGDLSSAWDGTFVALVPRGSFGTITVDESSCDPAKWSAGDEVVIACPSLPGRPIRVLDESGAPVLYYQFRRSLAIGQDRDGTMRQPRFGCRHSPDGVQWVGSISDPGDERHHYIKIPGRGLYRWRRSSEKEDSGVLPISLGDCEKAGEQVEVRIDVPSLGVEPSAWYIVRLTRVDNSGVKFTQGSSGASLMERSFHFRDLFSGSYELTVRVGRTVLHSSIVNLPIPHGTITLTW
jgi:hypothetical protein